MGAECHDGLHGAGYGTTRIAVQPYPATAARKTRPAINQIAQSGPRIRSLQTTDVAGHTGGQATRTSMPEHDQLFFKRPAVSGHISSYLVPGWPIVYAPEKTLKPPL